MKNRGKLFWSRFGIFKEVWNINNVYIGKIYINNLEDNYSLLIKMSTYAKNSYDNEYTLLYKYAKAAEIPISLVIVRPRTEEDDINMPGVNNFVFESLLGIITRLMSKGKTPAEVYSEINKYNSQIKVQDIIMSYYDLLYSPDDPDFYKILNDYYRQIDETIQQDRYGPDIGEVFQSWRESIKQRLIPDERRYNDIIEVQDELLELEQFDIDNRNSNIGILFSPVKINSTVMSYSPTINNVPVIPEDGPDIFNNAVVSEYIPYIRYNDKNGKGWTRVYTGGKIGFEPKYDMTIILPSDTKASNTIYMTLWLGDINNTGEEKVYNSSKDEFYKIVYDLDKNYLTVQSPTRTIINQGPSISLIRTQNALPTLNFGTGKEANVVGEFNIWNQQFEESSLLDAILVRKIMNVYLYLGESYGPFALKTHLEIRYRSIFTDIKENLTEFKDENPASIIIRLTQKEETNSKSISVLDPGSKIPRDEEIKIEEGKNNWPYIHINIVGGSSSTDIERFISIFRLLMIYYFYNKESIIEEYKNIYHLDFESEIDNFLLQKHAQGAKPVIPKNLNKQKGITQESPLDLLKQEIPYLFSKKYSRNTCPIKRNPKIISKNEVEEWKRKTIGNSTDHRQVMEFPIHVDDPKYFVCPGDEYPSPGVKINRLKSKDKYPYAPCCFKLDQMNSKSKYQSYINGTPPPEKIVNLNRRMYTQKIGEPGTEGSLPSSVRKIVSQYSEDPSETNMSRLGMIRSPNSLLHCICYSVDDPEYMKLENDNLKELYVSQLRQYIFNNINISVVKQELYDYSEEEIKTIFTDNRQFFDPSLFYRAVEEIFSINIYVFSDKSTKNEEKGSLKIPRNYMFHARPLRTYRPTVVIIRTVGAERDVLQYPQCELIVDYRKGLTENDPNTITKLFGDKMLGMCHTVLEESIKTLTWSVIPTTNDFELNSNIYYQIDYLDWFQVRAVSQFIDNYGKMRGLTFDLGNNKFMTIGIKPSQPENLPTTKQIHRVDINLALNIFLTERKTPLEPSGITKDENNNIDGLWFPIIGIKYGEYIPIIPVSEAASEAKGITDKLGPHNPLATEKFSITSRLRKMKHTLNIIVQVIKWLYELAKNKENLTVEEFVHRYINILVNETNITIDSSTYYDLSKISRKLPNVETVYRAIQIFSVQAPTLFQEGKIIMYDETFADRITKMLKEYNELLTEQTPAKYIDNYYDTETDFKTGSYEKLFMNDMDMNAWLTSLKGYVYQNRVYNLHRNVDSKMKTITDPYIYEDKYGKIYIIQNVIGGGNSKNRALNIVENWNINHINLGYDTDPLLTQPPHIIYGISSDFSLVPIFDQSNNHPDPLKIFYYGNKAEYDAQIQGRYAGLLEIF